MRTNVEKYNYYYKFLKDKQDEFIKEKAPQFTEEMFEVDINGKLYKVEVDSIGYYSGFYQLDKPSRNDIKRIKEYYEQDLELDIKKIRIFFSYRCNIGKHILNYSPFEAKERLLTLEQAKKKSEEIIKQKQKEDNLLNNGHFRCQYCSKITPEKDVFIGTIVSRMYKNYEAKFNYCSGKCAGNDQMAHEG